MIQVYLDKGEGPKSKSKKPWYDTKQGILASLNSLPELHQLLAERRLAGYERNERLNIYYILGVYMLDSAGNCCKGEKGASPRDYLPNIPLVMTDLEMRDHLRRRKLTDTPMSFAINGGNIPEAGQHCPVCSRTWTVQNCMDVVSHHRTDAFPLGDFVGKTLGEVKAAFAQKNEAIYRMQPDILIRNDRYIDLSPKYPGTQVDWQKSIVKNERGWLGEKDGITDDYIIQLGDEGFFNVWTYYHADCNRRHLAQEEEKSFREIFIKAGFENVRLTALSNEYCDCDHCAPWFNVETEFGVIKIGWRKRVINIDWSQILTARAEVGLKKIDFLSLFKDEDVTKEPDYIHAWGWEKAQEYLGRLLSRLAA
jgi:hypothetical protein